MLRDMDPATAWGLGKLLLMFLVIVAPAWLLMRSLVKLARLRYGFIPDPPDDGPPLRVCFGCNNSVLEPGFSHCPYCGKVLPVAPEAAASTPAAGHTGAADGPSV